MERTTTRIGELLPRCVRLVPHYDDCGGFFVAVFRQSRRLKLSTLRRWTRCASCSRPLTTEAEARDERSDANDGIDGSKSGKDGKGSKGSSYLGDASALVRLPPDSDEWRACLDFYGCARRRMAAWPGAPLGARTRREA